MISGNLPSILGPSYKRAPNLAGIGYPSDRGLEMNRIRLLAAIGNGALVLALYMGAWGAPAIDIAILEVALAAGAAVSTWYALRGMRRRTA